ncbi:hypothetical protein FQA39_LY04652 [Lamprigera yunnana]|nr:hypothetical protein FQA39_LY04652 [Lamprigera yunnana]
MDLDEERDIKPLINPSTHNLQVVNVQTEINAGGQKWLPGSWQDGNRTSAFQPYKQNLGTVLTNLQRGNTQAETPIPQEADINFHTRAGQGEITAADIKSETSVDVLDSDKLTALHWACAYGQITTTQLLLNYGAQIDKVGPEGETALLLAASGGHHEVVRLLLQEGADVNHIDDVGNTALMYAARGNHPHCCNELLFRGADTTIENHSHETAYNISIDFNSNLALAVIENYFLTLLGSS